MTTHRGPLEAQVRAPGTAPPEGSAVDGAVRRLAAGGGLLPGKPHDSGAYAASPLRVPSGTASRLLLEEREEGR